MIQTPFEKTTVLFIIPAEETVAKIEILRSKV